MTELYNRAAEDIGNIVALEHVNVRVPDQGPATVFYVSGLGLTRDPYMMTSTDNMWVNVGRSQFHLPTGAPQMLRGRVGLVLPDREGLLARLARVRPMLEGTHFTFRETNEFVEATCPWGNVVRCHVPADRAPGTMQLGMAYVEFDVPPGAAAGIAAFYREVFGALATEEAGVARVGVGQGQEFVFRETARRIPDYDGHHVQIYIAHFSRPHRELSVRGLVTQESSRWQYRFQRIVEPVSGAALFEIEHEVRSLTHPLYARPLVNRNPDQIQRAYVPGRDFYVPDWPHSQPS